VVILGEGGASLGGAGCLALLGLCLGDSSSESLVFSSEVSNSSSEHGGDISVTMGASVFGGSLGGSTSGSGGGASFGSEDSHSVGMGSGDSGTVTSEFEGLEGGFSSEVSCSSGSGASLGSKDSHSLGVGGSSGEV